MDAEIAAAFAAADARMAAGFEEQDLRLEAFRQEVRDNFITVDERLRTLEQRLRARSCRDAGMAAAGVQ